MYFPTVSPFSPMVKAPFPLTGKPSGPYASRSVCLLDESAPAYGVEPPKFISVVILGCYSNRIAIARAQEHILGIRVSPIIDVVGLAVLGHAEDLWTIEVDQLVDGIVFPCRAGSKCEPT